MGSLFAVEIMETKVTLKKHYLKTQDWQESGEISTVIYHL